jgi:hypothetical protein
VKGVEAMTQSIEHRIAEKCVPKAYSWFGYNADSVEPLAEQLEPLIRAELQEVRLAVIELTNAMEAKRRLPSAGSPVDHVIASRRIEAAATRLRAVMGE